jgi:glycosyltransferase involved in cell wall biosynthesis
VADLVSVIVPVHDGERFLDETLTGIANQTYPDLEAVVVDDGSADGGADVARRWMSGRPRDVLVRQPRAGVAGARNTGLARSAGPLVAFCDQDDVWHADKLARQVDYLAHHPDVSVVLVRQAPFLDGLDQPPGWLRPDRVYGDPGGVLPCTALVRRAAFDDVGGFDEAKPGADDFDWLLRACRAGVGIAVLPVVLVRRRVHSGNATYDLPTLRRGLLDSVRGIVHARRCAP